MWNRSLVVHRTTVLTKRCLKFRSLDRNYCDIKTNVELLFRNSESPTIPSVLRIKRAIKSQTHHELHDGFSCIRTKCPACPMPAQPSKALSQREDIYINKSSGDVICLSCQHIYSFSAIEPFFGDARNLKHEDSKQKMLDLFIRAKPSIRHFSPDEIDDKAISKDRLQPGELADICAHLGIEKIADSAFDDLHLLCNVSEKRLYFPMQDAEGKFVGYKTLSRGANGMSFEETVPPSNSFGAIVVLPHSASKRPQKEHTKSAIVVLNLLDVLAILSQKINATVICLPYGFKSLPQECLPVLEPYQKLILWFDYNSVGWDIAKNFAKKLDERRCDFVRPTENHPTPYNAIQQSIGIKTILSSAKPILHRAITTFKSLRLDILSDLQNIDKVEGIKWKRYPILNNLLKGHRRGELSILTGPTGCGKTTFMSEYSLDLAMQGVSTLWGSFEIRNSRLAMTLLQQFVGKPLEDHIDEFDMWANTFELLPMYFMTFHGQQALKVVMEAIEHAQYVHDIHHVIIDNLQFMMGTMDESRHMDRFWKQDEIIAAFRSFATRKNCHVTLVIHPRKERDDDDLTTNSIFGSAKATQEADNVLIIQDKRLKSVKGMKYLQIAKNRYSGDLGIMVLEFDKEKLSYTPKKRHIDGLTMPK